MAAPMSGIDLGKLGTKQENLRRVVYPEQHDYQGAGSAIARCHGTAADVEADQRLPYAEQQGRDNCADHNIMPFDPPVW